MMVYMSFLSRILLVTILFTLIPCRAAILPLLPGPVNKGEIEVTEAKIFPELKSKNLEGKEYLLPKDLDTEISILVLAYKRKQQKNVDAWLTAIKENKLDICPSIKSYELPVLKQFNPFIRFNIDNGMRYGIDDKDKREHVLSIYVDKESFNKSLNITSEEDVHILVIRKNGNILWQEEGDVNEEKLTALKSFFKIIDLVSFDI